MEKLRLTERRQNARYDLRFPLHYHVSQKGVISRSGSGLTADISTTGVSFRCRKPLPEGAHVEMVIDWPAKYGDLYPVDLLITGFVVRSDAARTAVRMTSKKFRVASAPEQPVQATA
jgi:c-di-GMP-binding flagellar brake protein YcgR